MAEIQFHDVSKRYGDGPRAVANLELEIRDGEFMVFVGPSGCGKTTALRMVAGLEEITEGEVQYRRPRRERPIAEGPRRRDGLPELRAVSTHDRRPEPRFRPQVAQGREERGGAARPARGRDPGPRGVPRSQAAGAVRWTTAARRDGTRDRPRATGVPDGRTALQPRREAARADACGDPEAPALPRRDDDLRDARPDGGDDDGRPDRRHARRRPTAGRYPRARLSAAGESVRRGVHRLAGDEHRRCRCTTSGQWTSGRLRRPRVDCR